MSRPCVAVVGGRGQLGRELCRQLGESGCCLDLPELDITDGSAVAKALVAGSYETVINCAAQTHVDGCEQEPAQAFAVNALGALHVAQACRQAGTPLVYVSTDYVFGGDRSRSRPYDEQDRPDPINVYGCTKLAGEFFSRHYNPRAFIVRTSGLYGHAGARGKGGNFVGTMLRLARQHSTIRIVDDQRLSPTAATEMATRILALIRTERYGTYHIAASDNCTWYDFAKAIFEINGVSVTAEPISTEAYGAPADRPRCSALASRQLKEANVSPCPGWREMLEAYLRTAQISSPGTLSCPTAKACSD
jgi:dTDP-4-dehydrorhamnose reductase